MQMHAMHDNHEPKNFDSKSCNALWLDLDGSTDGMGWVFGTKEGTMILRKPNEATFWSFWGKGITRPVRKG